MSSSFAGSSGNARQEPLSLPLGRRNSKSEIRTEEKQLPPRPFDCNGTQIQHSTTAFDHSDGADVTTKPSMATRLGDSASGLMSDVLGTSSANGLLSRFAAGTTDGSKSQSSSSTSGPSESSTAVQNFKSGPNAGVASSEAAIPRESFRSSPTVTQRTEKGAQYEFDEFLFNGDGPLVAEHGTKEIYNGRLNSHTEHDQMPVMVTQSATSLPLNGDGAAVVALLSEPDFSADDPSAYQDMYDQEVAVTDPLISRLTSQQLDLLTKIKAQLPQPPIHRAPAPTNPLNLLPSFDQLSSDTNGQSGWNATTTLHAGESYTYLTSDSTNTWSHGEVSNRQFRDGTEAHLLQWLDVLNRYQDEVWGDILPLVQDARKEIEQAKNRNDNEVHEGPAVRRLGMVFAHLQTSAASIKT